MNNLSDFVAIIMPVAIFFAFVAGVWFMLSLISQRNAGSQDRLQRMTTKSMSQSSFDMPDPTKLTKREDRMKGFADAMSNLSGAMQPKSEAEASELKMKLTHAGFRSDSAVSVYLGLRFASLLIFSIVGAAIYVPKSGMTMTTLKYMAAFVGLGMYLPQIVLWFLISSRKQEIFLTLPDTLDLLVVCVEAGLGLDAAMRKVSEEMKEHCKVLSEEMQLSNFQLQMGRPRRDVLHDLGVRTGVDDVRSLAAILIQADRFGSSIAQALRVQSDSMRVKRRQLAEEKAAKTAVQLIFPLVLFIFPSIFVVLVGPAAIKITETILK